MRKKEKEERGWRRWKELERRWKWKRWEGDKKIEKSEKKLE